MKTMNAEPKLLPTSFGPEIRFAVETVPAAPFRAVQESRFEALKSRLLELSLKTVGGSGLAGELRRSANEAASLAWSTSYPLLVFPLLFEERAKHAIRGGGWGRPPVTGDLRLAAR
jgi:hypothetical protein